MDALAFFAFFRFEGGRSTEVWEVGDERAM